MMKTHHANILSLEKSMHTSAGARQVWDACLYLNMKPVRLLLEYFRRDKYLPSSMDGQHLLMGLMTTLADNKIVEDIHAPLRLASRGNSNDKLSTQTVQDIITHSAVLDERGIRQTVGVSKECCV